MGLGDLGGFIEVGTIGGFRIGFCGLGTLVFGFGDMPIGDFRMGFGDFVISNFFNTQLNRF